MHGEHWSSLTLTTALLYPGIAFVAFFSLNFFIWAQGATARARAPGRLSA
jgi:hypothetical protein